MTPDLADLDAHKSWKLERISPTAAPADILLRMQDMLSAAEIDAFRKLHKTGACYRCRIGRGRYFFGRTIIDAVAATLTAERTKRGKKKNGQD